MMKGAALFTACLALALNTTGSAETDAEEGKGLRGSSSNQQQPLPLELDLGFPASLQIEQAGNSIGHDRQALELNLPFPIPQICFTPRVTFTIGAGGTSLETRATYMQGIEAIPSVGDYTSTPEELRTLLDQHADIFADPLFDALQARNVDACRVPTEYGSSTQIICYSPELCYAPVAN